LSVLKSRTHPALRRCLLFLLPVACRLSPVP
jgi:hypothetical protein